MRKGFGLELPEHLGATGANVVYVEFNPFGDVLAFTRGEVVYDGHLVAAVQQMLRYVRSYKACATGDQNSHSIKPSPHAFIAQQNSRDSMLFFSREPVEKPSLL